MHRRDILTPPAGYRAPRYQPRHAKPGLGRRLRAALAGGAA